MRTSGHALAMPDRTFVQDDRIDRDARFQRLDNGVRQYRIRRMWVMSHAQITIIINVPGGDLTFPNIDRSVSDQAAEIDPLHPNSGAAVFNAVLKVLVQIREGLFGIIRTIRETIDGDERIGKASVNVVHFYRVHAVINRIPAVGCVKFYSLGEQQWFADLVRGVE